MNLIIVTINLFFKVMEWLIIISVLLSWFRGAPRSITEPIHNLTNPIMAPVRNMVRNSPIGSGMIIDFSPIIVLFLMEIVRQIILSVILLVFG